MIELGPHSLTLVNQDGDTHAVSVSITLNDAEAFTFEDGHSIDEFVGHVVITGETFERTIECVGLNSLELVGRLMMLGEAYLTRTCEVENLTIFKTIPDDVKFPTDIFR
jgi:hypothetical protein